MQSKANPPIIPIPVVLLKILIPLAIYFAALIPTAVDVAAPPNFFVISCPFFHLKFYYL